MADVLPEVPFGGPEQTQPGFIQGMVQSLASPFNPAPNPLPAPTGPAPMAGPSVTNTPPLGGSQGGGVMDVLGKVGQVAANFLIGMGDDSGKIREQMRKQRAARATADMMVQVDAATQAGDIPTARNLIAKASGVVSPEFVPMLQKQMDRITKVEDAQQFSDTLIPNLQMTNAGLRPEVMGFLDKAKKTGMDPKLQIQGLLEIFKYTPHFQDGVMILTSPLGGAEKVEITPVIPKVGDYTKFSAAILGAGYPSVADFVYKLAQHDPQAMADSMRMPQAQNAIEQSQEMELTRQKSAVEEGRQKRVAAASIGLQAAKDKEVFMFKQLNELPPPEARMYAKATGVSPDKPVGKYTEEEANRVIQAKKSDDIAKQAMQGYEAARAGVEAKPIPPEVTNKILLNRQVLRGLKTVEANLEDSFVGKGFQGEAGALWGQIRDTTGKSSESEIFFRRSINDVGDMLLRARSGAQINEQEYKRLTGLLPKISDEPTTFRAALKRVITEVEADIKDRAKFAKQPAGTLNESDLSDVGPVQKMQHLTPGGRKMGR